MKFLLYSSFCDQSSIISHSYKIYKYLCKCAYNLKERERERETEMLIYFHAELRIGESWSCVTSTWFANNSVNKRILGTYLPRPRMPLAPLARQSRRSFSVGSVVVCMARWALLIISSSCLVVALWGLRLNIAKRRNVISLTWQVWVRWWQRREREPLLRSR